MDTSQIDRLAQLVALPTEILTDVVANAEIDERDRRRELLSVLRGLTGARTRGLAPR